MDRSLNREILRLSLPSILANLTVPLVGFVDTAVAGHLDGGAAVFIGAISLGSMLFNLLYWNFGFLRTGTSPHRPSDGRTPKPAPAYSTAGSCSRSAFPS